MATKSKANGKHPPKKTEDAPAPTDGIKYNEAVREGKEILKRTDVDQLRLGELADKVMPIYGEGTLARLASEIGIAHCTLERRRDVYRAWKDKDIGAPGAPFLSYSVLQELAAHPDRAEIVRDNPGITKRQAREAMRRFNGEEKKDKGSEDWRRNEIKRYLSRLSRLANEVVSATSYGVHGGKQWVPFERSLLRELIEPKLLPAMREASEAFTKVIKGLEQLCAEEDEQAVSIDDSMADATSVAAE